MSTLRTNAIQTVAGKPILNSTGSVIQVVNFQFDTTWSAFTSGVVTDVPGFNTSITPSSTSSKVLLIVHVSGLVHCDGFWGLKRNGSIIKNSFIGTDRSQATSGGWNNDDCYTVCGTYLDSPASTSAVSYQIFAKTAGCDNTAFINYSRSLSDNNGKSGITLLEISA